MEAQGNFLNKIPCYTEIAHGPKGVGLGILPHLPLPPVQFWEGDTISPGSVPGLEVSKYCMGVMWKFLSSLRMKASCGYVRVNGTVCEKLICRRTSTGGQGFKEPFLLSPFPFKPSLSQQCFIKQN